MNALKHAMILVAAAILCLGIGTAATAESIYDFDNGRVTGSASPGSALGGQDGWYEFDFYGTLNAKVRNDLAGSYTGIDGLATYNGNTNVGYVSRMNDEYFGYSIPAGAEFRLEFNTLLTANTCWSFFALAKDVDEDGTVNESDGGHSELAFRFGFSQLSGGHWAIREAEGGATTLSSSAPSQYGEVWRIVLDVDMTNSDGAGSMSVQRLSGENPDTVLTPVTDMQNIALGIDGCSVGAPETWDAIFIDFARGSAIDNLKITVIPEPGTGLLLILGLAGFGLFLRRR